MTMEKSYEWLNLSEFLEIFFFVFTKVGDRAGGTVRIFGFAAIATMQKNPVMGFFHKVFGNDFDEFFFDFERGLTWSKACSVAHSEDVRVNSDRGLTEGNVQNNVGGFSTDAGQAFQIVTIVGNNAIETIAKDLA